MGPLDSSQREPLALRIVERLYRAAMDPAQWHHFAAEFGEATGGTAVTLAIRRPETRLGWDYYGAGSRDLAILVAEDLQGALARAARRVDRFRHGFVDLGEAFPRITLEQDGWFRQWLLPHGIEPDWPLAHAVSVDQKILCWILVQRPREGEFDAAGTIALGAELVPHFSRALALHRDLAAQNHKQRALDEILDRLPLGMILFDAGRRVVHTNLSAQRMIGLADGLDVKNDLLRAGHPDDGALQDAVDSVIRAALRGDLDFVRQLTVATRSGRRPFMVALTPIPPRPSSGRGFDPVAVGYVSNPDAISTASVQALEAVYGLTKAEAAVVRGLIEGQSMEEIASQRRVKPDTARSQLKQVFAKTRTNRQAELIRLVLTGVSPLAQSAHPSEDTPT